MRGANQNLCPDLMAGRSCSLCRRTKRRWFLNTLTQLTPVSSLMLLKDGRHTSLLYLALNPVYASAPLSGGVNELYGGRFNTKDTPALCTALAPTATPCEVN